MTMLEQFNNTIQQPHKGTNIFTRHQGDTYTQIDYITTPPEHKRNTPTILGDLPEGNPLRESDHYLIKQRTDIPTHKQFRTKIERLPPSLKGWDATPPETLNFIQKRSATTSRGINNNQNNLVPELVRIARMTPQTTTRTRENTNTTRSSKQ